MSQSEIDALLNSSPEEQGANVSAGIDEIAPNAPSPDPMWNLVRDTGEFRSLPEKLETAHDAIDLIGYALRSKQQAFLEEADRRLEGFVRDRPGVLEEAFMDRREQDRLACTALEDEAPDLQSEAYPRATILSAFLLTASPFDDSEQPFFGQTCRTIQPLPMLEALLSMFSRYDRILEFEACRLIIELAEYIGPDAFRAEKTRWEKYLSPARYDQMYFCSHLNPYEVSDRRFANGEKTAPPFPDILPADEEILTMTPDEILWTLAGYRGTDPGSLLQSLYDREYLSRGEHVGYVILEDVRRLVDLGVERHTIARRMDELLRMHFEVPHEKREQVTELLAEKTVHPGSPRLAVFVCGTRGTHPEPFHEDWIDQMQEGGSAECRVENLETGEYFDFGDLQPYLIRRAGFFQGTVAHRVEPEQACRVLGLIGA